jgi:hypothetical protein
LSRFRALSYVKSVKFHHAVTGSAVAVVAVAAGAVGAWPGGAQGQPTVTVRQDSVVRGLPAGQAGPARTLGTRSFTTSRYHPGTASAALSAALSAAQPARLDAFLATASQHGSDMAVSTGGVAGRRARRKAETARQIAVRLLHRFGWSRRRQFRYLNPLWERESSWNVRAWNPYSGAYGIPQADPGAKMASAGWHWRSCARTQILWGLRYIKARYGTPAAAWRHELATGWY